MEHPVQERLLKVLVVGDYAVGKTSLIRRFCTDEYSENYRITIGVDYHEKTSHEGPKGRTRVQLWDIAGHERFGSMTRTYYKYAVGAVVVFDVTRETSLESTLRWLGDVNSKVLLPNNQSIPSILLGNKFDMLPEEVKDEARKKFEGFASANGFCGFEPVSAKTGANVPDAFSALLKRVDSATEGVALFVPQTQEATMKPTPYLRPGLKDTATYERDKIKKQCCK